MKVLARAKPCALKVAIHRAVVNAGWRALSLVSTVASYPRPELRALRSG